MKYHHDSVISAIWATRCNDWMPSGYFEGVRYIKGDISPLMLYEYIRAK